MQTIGRRIRITPRRTFEFSVSAVRHLLTYDAPANQLFRVLAAGWHAKEAEDADQVETLLALCTGTPDGSSTSSDFDVVKGSPGDAAHGGTIYRNSSETGVTITADTIFGGDAGPVNGGFVYRPSPEELVVHPAGSQVTMLLNVAPQSGVTVRPWMLLELFGA